MALFETSYRFTLANEGGLVEDVNDPGGTTNCGISLRFLQSLPVKNRESYGINIDFPTAQTIRDLTPDQIKQIYFGEFWQKIPFEKIQNQLNCNYIFDMCFHHGIEQGIKLAQRSIWACQKQRDYVKDDGILGAFTLQGINQCSFMLLVAMQAQRDGFYRMLVDKNPARMGELDGWLNRCYRV